MGSNKTTDVNNNKKQVSSHLVTTSSCATNSGTNKRGLKHLQKEHEELKQTVAKLAIFNYAREPDFVRDRNKLRDTLDEVANLRRSIQCKYVNRILGQLERAQVQIDTEARSAEEKSERMAKDFLDANIGHEDFLERYINIRKNAIQKRIIADKLTKERSKLDENVSGTSPRNNNNNNNNKTFAQQNSPTPTPRQRKRLSLVANLANAESR